MRYLPSGDSDRVVEAMEDVVTRALAPYEAGPHSDLLLDAKRAAGLAVAALLRSIPTGLGPLAGAGATSPADVTLLEFLEARNMALPVVSTGRKAVEDAAALMTAVEAGDVDAVRSAVADLAVVAAVVARRYGFTVEDAVAERAQQPPAPASTMSPAARDVFAKLMLTATSDIIPAAGRLADADPDVAGVPWWEQAVSDSADGGADEETDAARTPKVTSVTWTKLEAATGS